MYFYSRYFFCSCSAGELNKIEVFGAKRLHKQDILSHVDFSVGDDITGHELNLLLKKLYRTGLFADVSLEIKDGLVKINVKESPILFNITIEGNKFASTSDIKKALNLKKDSIFNQALLEKGLKEVSALYRLKGRPNTKVSYQIINKSPGVVEVLIKVRETKSLKISRIRFFGNEKFMDFDLKKAILSKEFTILRILGSSYYYVEECTPIDIEMLKLFYQSSGYFDFRVKDLKSHQKENNIYLDFYLHEGVQYQFGKISIKNSITGVNEPELEKVIGLNSGDVFNIKEVERESLRIVNYLNSKGYLFVNVRPEYKGVDSNVDVVFNVLDAKKMYIDNINITGNTRTQDDVIRRELQFAEREPYNQNKLNSSKRSLFGLGFFDAVDFISKPIDDQNVDIDLNIKERTTGYINLSGGYGSDTGVFGNVAFTESNLLGTGNKIALSLKRSLKDFDGSFDFTKTRLLDTKITGQFSVFRSVADKEHESSYKTSSNGFSVGAGYDISDDLRNNLFYSFKSTNIYDLQQDASASIKDQAGRNNISMIGYAFICWHAG